MSAIAMDRLIRVGLTQYEARVYMALIRRDGSTPGEVATLAGVPRPRIYDVLHSLAAKGLATERPGRTAKYLATPPAEAMELLLAAHRQQIDLLEADARALSDELTPAFQEGRAHDSPLDYIEVIRDPERLARRFVEMEGLVSREMLAFSKSPAVLRVDRNTAGIELAATHTLRSVYEFSVLTDPVQREGVRRFVAAGEQARFVPELPMKLVLIDERTVMFAMADPVAGKDDLTTVIIDHPALAKFLKIAFEAVWETGVDIEKACRHLGIAYPENG
jgi:HTH-type transcriptional regulator, sugar sensing transcriptional regulator